MIIQDDEFLTPQQAAEAEAYILQNARWQFCPKTNKESQDKESFFGDAETFQFVTQPLLEPSMIGDQLQYIFEAFMSKHKIKVTNIIRVKCNLLTQGTSDGYHSVHIDQNFPHKVFLYYISNSDGDTVFFDRSWEPNSAIEQKDLKEELRVSPKRGRGVVFDGLQYHCSTSPIKSKFRAVINVDFL